MDVSGKNSFNSVWSYEGCWGFCGTSVVEKVPVISKNKAHEGGYVSEKDINSE